MKPFSVVVLAAGASSRMGAVKQLLRVGEKTFIEQVLDSAKQLNPQSIVCVLGANYSVIEAIMPKDIIVLQNKEWPKGMGKSLAQGVEYLCDTNPSLEAVLVLLADQPTIALADLKQMIYISANNPQKIIASDYEGFAGVPVLFPKKYFVDLINLEGDQGARNMLKGLGNEVQKYKHSAPIKDVDTPDEYLQLSHSRDLKKERNVAK
jgi:molybdenum cofactor cytidylyltransferase